MYHFCKLKNSCAMTNLYKILDKIVKEILKR